MIGMARIYESEYWPAEGNPGDMISMPPVDSLGRLMTERSEQGWDLDQFVSVPDGHHSTRVLLVWSKDSGDGSVDPGLAMLDAAVSDDAALSDAAVAGVEHALGQQRR